MKPEELIEKVAVAIGAETLGDVPHLDWTTYRAEAVAALRVVRDALREPDEGMEDAGHNALRGWIVPVLHASDAWRAMLAAHPISRIEE